MIIFGFKRKINGNIYYDFRENKKKEASPIS